jgi:membrane protease YdiL (CAAX protease family)
MATPYHRLARETPAYRWWRLPLAGLLGVALYLLAAVVLVAVAAVSFEIAGGDGADRLDSWLDSAGTLDLQRPEFFALDMLGIAVLIPVVMLAVLITGPRPVGYLSSVTGRLRWSWLGTTALMSFAVFAVTIGLTVVITELVDPASSPAPTDVDGRLVVVIVLVLLLTPFQAAAEEYVFRGYLLQLIGSWTRFAIIPIVLSVLPFVAGHAYGVWGLVDVGIFGLTAAFLTVRTGGLEAAISAHVANNVVLLLLDAAGVVDSSDDTEATALDLVPTVVACAVLVLWVLVTARRQGIARTRDPIAAPTPPQGPMWPPPPYAYPPQPYGYAPVPRPMAYVPQPPPRPVPVGQPPVPPNAPPYPGEISPTWPD